MVLHCVSNKLGNNQHKQQVKVTTTKKTRSVLQGSHETPSDADAAVALMDKAANSGDNEAKQMLGKDANTLLMPVEPVSERLTFHLAVLCQHCPSLS